ncbi:c-type cytochrome [uncultured Helicobacter sp.]|uniref:c-type cytochrome n=2 Tax=uncultured Helicobacter sp. TaxID=175537 RepID=UPI0025DAC464|nr:c-type cytochrome [uncultured Helicobacter sp.]
MLRYILFVLCIIFVACSSDNKVEQAADETSGNKVEDRVEDSQKDMPEADKSQAPQQTLPAAQNKPDAAVLYAKCAACHGKDGKSVAPGSVGNVLIASLNKAQVVESLKGFRERTLSKGGNSIIMYMQAKNLSDEDIDALATYIDAF